MGGGEGILKGGKSIAFVVTKEPGMFLFGCGILSTLNKASVIFKKLTSGLIGGKCRNSTIRLMELRKISFLLCSLDLGIISWTICRGLFRVICPNYPSKYEILRNWV